jgi:hypothetical protein
VLKENNLLNKEDVIKFCDNHILRDIQTVTPDDIEGLEFTFYVFVVGGNTKKYLYCVDVLEEETQRNVIEEFAWIAGRHLDVTKVYIIAQKERFGEKHET